MAQLTYAEAMCYIYILLFSDTCLIKVDTIPQLMSAHVTGTSCQLLSTHISSWQLVSARVSSCQLMLAHVSSCQLMSAHVSSCQLMSAHVSSCQLMSATVCSCQLLSVTVSSARAFRLKAFSVLFSLKCQGMHS